MIPHLILHPLYGMCNRLRVLAAALRIYQHREFKLTVVWTGGGLRQLLQLPSDIEVVTHVPNTSGYAVFSDPDVIDMDNYNKLYVKSYVAFTSKGLERIGYRPLARYLHPSPAVLAKSRMMMRDLQISGSFFTIHIRRGDSVKCIEEVPTKSYYAIIALLVEKNPAINIMLGCEDIALRHDFKTRYPRNIIIATQKTHYWQQDEQHRYDIARAIDDFAELLVLSKGEYVIGAWYSSYSEMIISFNGDERSFLLNGQRARMFLARDHKGNDCLSRIAFGAQDNFGV